MKEQLVVTFLLEQVSDSHRLIYQQPTNPITYVWLSIKLDLTLHAVRNTITWYAEIIKARDLNWLFWGIRMHHSKELLWSRFWLWYKD